MAAIYGLDTYWRSRRDADRAAHRHLQAGNLDDEPDQRPTLVERAAVLQSQLARLRADVLCLQEVHGQLPPGGDPASDRTLAALTTLLAGTRPPATSW